MLRVRKFGKFHIIGKTAEKGVALIVACTTESTGTHSTDVMGDGAKLEGFLNPSTEIMKTKPGLIEVSLRGFAVVSDRTSQIYT
jgi:hypothetical protein